MVQCMRVATRYCLVGGLVIALWACDESGNNLPQAGQASGGNSGGSIGPNAGDVGGSGGVAGSAIIVPMMTAGEPQAGQVVPSMAGSGGGVDVIMPAGIPTSGMMMEAGGAAGMSTGGDPMAGSFGGTVGGQPAGGMVGGRPMGGGPTAGMAVIGGSSGGSMVAGQPIEGGAGGAMAGGQPVVVPRCGDGLINRDNEQCDDGNQIDDDRCTNNCTVAGVQTEFNFPANNLIQVLGADPRFTQLARIILVAGVELNRDLVDGTRTFFAPTDATLNVVFSGNRADELVRLKSRGDEALEFVRRHLIRGNRDLDNLRTLTRLGSLSGRFLSLNVDEDNTVSIEGVDLAEPALRASNGRIYPVAGVIELGLPVETPTCEQPEELDAPAAVVGSLVDVRQAVYRITIPENGPYCVDTRGSAFDTVLRVELNCAQPSGNPDRANDNPSLEHTIDGVKTRSTHENIFRSARLAMEFRQGDVVDVIVNGASFPWGGNDAGDFIVNVESGPCRPYTIGDYLDAQGQFSTFLSLLEAFQLGDILDEETSTTVLAPTDEAFANFEAEAPGELAERALDGAEMWELLNYHLIGTAYLQRGLADTGLVPTVLGPPIDSVLRVSQVFVNGSGITGPDRVLDNGVAHVVDGVLSPPEACENDMCLEQAVCIQGWCLPEPPPGSVMDELRRTPEFSIFVSLVDFVDDEIGSGLARQLSDPGTVVTLFAPPNDAFENADLAALRQDPEGLTRTLRYHVGLGAFDSDELLLVNRVPTAIDEDLPVAQGQAGIRVGNVPIVTADRIASNGYIHKLASVLVAPDIMNACDEAIAIEEPGELVGSTLDAGAIYEASCIVSAGPEQVYRFRPDEDGRYCIHTLNSPNIDGTDTPLDTVLYIREADCADPLAAVVGLCNDNCDGAGCLNVNQPSQLSSITAELEGNTDYFIFVDTYVQGQAAPRGNFSLTVSEGAGCGEEVPAQTIREIIAGRQELSKFNELITLLDGQDAGLILEQPWPGAQQHTVFVPTNDAILQYGDDAWAALLADRARLRAVVEYHLLGRRVPERVLDGSSAFVTVEGTPLVSDSRGGETIVGGSRILESDILASNGLIHVIDSVIVPPDTCMADMDCADGLVCVDAGVCVEPPPLYSCENPFIIPTDNLAPVVFSGNTNDQVSAEAARCAQGAEGPDHVYLLKGEGRFGAAGDEPVDVCLTTIGSDFDTALHVRRGECNGPEIACEDDVEVVFGDRPQLQIEAQLTLSVEPGEQYYIFLDSSERLLSGEYELSVFPGACEI